MKNAWQGFKTGRWTKEIDVRGFIQANYTPYEGDDSFLAGATENTKKLWDKAMDLFKKERDNGGTLDVDTKTVSAIDAYAAGYLDKELETVVGSQISNVTDIYTAKTPQNYVTKEKYLLISDYILNPLLLLEFYIQFFQSVSMYILYLHNFFILNKTKLLQI